jgi:superfamily II DNA or RNA helicase
MNRTERQTLGLQKWSAIGYRGIAEYPTGFGKTYTALRAIQGMIKRKDIQTVLVIVPTVVLKEQWEKELKKHKITIAEVCVINTAIKSYHAVDMLILDEIHRYAAETFKLIFEKTVYTYLLGLTATLERADNLHEIILEYVQVFDTITIQEALENGWISPYLIYNVAVPFPNDELIEYRKADNAFKYLAAQMGRGTKAFKTATAWIKSRNQQQAGMAARYYNSLRKRKKVCLNNSNKIPAVKSIVDLFPDRNGLIFSADTAFADSLQEVLGDTTLTFHSKLKKSDQTYVMKRFKDGRTKVRMLSTCKALNEGFDVPECSLGIVAGSNSTSLTFIQQLGRVVRHIPGKHAVFINLYTPDTQEVKWMEKRMKNINASNIRNVTLPEFIEIFENSTDSLYDE